MNLPKQKRRISKVPNRKKYGLFNPAKLLSSILLILILAFSICAVGYVIFFRTVVAQEIPMLLHKDIAYEEANPPQFGAGFMKKNLEEKPLDMTKEGMEFQKSKLPKVAIIIDDMGYDEVIGKQLLGFPIELTFSFLPFAPHTRKLERLAHRGGKTVFLHLPLEPKDNTFNPGPGALYLNDSPELQREKFAKNLEEVPHAVGVNNHMGSAFTENRPSMSNIIHELKQRSLLFVDSFTTPGTLGYQLARQDDVKSFRRSVFLDNDLDEEKICDKLEQLVILSEKTGTAIGIGHPHRETVSAISRCAKKYLARIQYVGVRDLLE